MTNLIAVRSYCSTQDLEKTRESLGSDERESQSQTSETQSNGERANASSIKTPSITITERNQAKVIAKIADDSTTL